MQKSVSGKGWARKSVWKFLDKIQLQLIAFGSRIDPESDSLSGRRMQVAGRMTQLLD